MSLPTMIYYIKRVMWIIMRNSHICKTFIDVITLVPIPTVWFNNHNFIMESIKNDEEAHKIFNIITTLKKENKIKNYSDVAVLSRKNNNKTITKLIDLFIENDVGFTIKGLSDLDEKDEVKSFIIMLWYVTRNTRHGHVPSNDELDKLNLKAFCGEYFNPTFWSLSKETKDYLNSIQDSFFK